jgi:hypothetical protein
VLLPLLGALLSIRRWMLLRCGCRVFAKIVGFEKFVPSSDAETIHLPIVEFNDDHGRKVRMTLSGEPPEEGTFIKGSRLRLVYPRGNPKGAKYDNTLVLLLVPAMCFAPALIFIVFIAGSIVWQKLFG